jgi:hypothetical protein
MSQARPQTQVDCVNLRDPLYVLDVTLEQDQGSWITVIHVDYDGNSLVSDGPVRVTYGASDESYVGGRLQFLLKEDSSHRLSGQLTDVQGIVPNLFFSCRKLR